MNFRNSIWFILLLGFGCSSSEENQQSEAARPNVVIIFTDDQGYADVGVFGAEGFTTPNLDKMASEGMVLTNFYSAQAVCSASRAGLLTGCYPNRIGIHQAFMPNAKIGLNQNEETIAELLKEQGYATAIYGKWHLGDHPDFIPLNHGFDEYFGIPYSNDMWPYHPQQGPIFDFGPLPLYENNIVIDTLEDQSMLTTQITERSIDFIKRKKDGPFFLYVAHPQPHVPLFVSDKFKGKSERGLYGDVIMEIDWSVGQILKTLKEEGLDDNTLVLFTSDNGPWLAYGDHAGSSGPFREGKGTAWEGGQKEPFIVRWPGKILPGQTSSVTTMAIDILPTIVEVTGANMPKLKIDGQSAWKVWTGESTSSPQEAYFCYYRVNELHSVRYDKWKLYFPHSYRSLNGREGGVDGFPVNYEQLKVEKIELYDLSSDVSETTNLALKYPEIIEHISMLADSMRYELGDALTNIKGANNRAPGRVVQ